MKITKGLNIADPWIGFILDGRKTWEMRSRGTSFRGWFGLIRKGTGAVWGVARLVDIGKPLSRDEMLAHRDKHRIPESMIRSGEAAKWNTPWVLANVTPLRRPVPYQHKNGAVTWVKFDPDVSAAIARQLGLSETGEEAVIMTDASSKGMAQISKVERVAMATSGPIPGKAGRGTLLGEVDLSEGNLRNNHIYLRSFFHKFPSDAIGGSNKAQRALRAVTVEWGEAESVETDLVDDKRFFRGRGWVRRFFEETGAEAGDRVRVLVVAPYRYRVELTKSRGEAA